LRVVPLIAFSIVNVEGLRPATPQNADGQRIEPFVSSPTAAGTIRAASAAPLPPLLPPEMRVVSYGLCTAPYDSLWADIWCIKPSTTFMSGQVVLQNGIAPAATSRPTTAACFFGMYPLSAEFPPVDDSPATASWSFTANGSPAAAPSFTPRARDRSTSRAASSTRAGSIVVATFRSRCASYCFSNAPTYDSAVMSPDAMRVTASRAPSSRIALPDCCAARIPGRPTAAATRLAMCSGMIAAADCTTCRREMPPVPLWSVIGCGRRTGGIRRHP